MARAQRFARFSRFSWGLYALCASAVLGALAFVSRTALDLERRTVAAAGRERRQERARTALWRLDSALLPLLTREGARPYFEYLAYYPQERSYTRYLCALEKGEVLVPSPLLNFAPEHVQLHFQVDRDGQWSSPQAPRGNLRDLAESTCAATNNVIPRSTTVLERVVKLVPLAEVRAAVARAEAAEAALAESGSGVRPSVVVRAPAQSVDPAEFQARQKNAYKTKKDAQSDAEQSNRQAPAGDEPVAAIDVVKVGALVPMWLGPLAGSGASEPELFFFRRVEVGKDELLQGVLLDWRSLERSLLDEIAELLPGARLEPVRDAGQGGSVLAAIPARLVVPESSEAADVLDARGQRGMTAASATLAVAWGAVLVALVGGAWLLRSSFALGERRSRFASAVTHELRTPLTTFRMYSEMLADGMVREPEQRRVYLETLKEQSGRLATLVENVLAYARLEEGRARAQRSSVAVASLVERHRDALVQRCRAASMELALAVDPAVAASSLTTDPDAVGQVLFNLVDNACKYARDHEPRRVELTVAGAGPRDARLSRVEFVVRDHGPGVAPPLARAIFRPFERGARNGDPTPGVGLGLALARGLAHDLGGTLELREAREADGEGAHFVLSLPLD
jgi:signal transduction histidine kinase